MNLRYDKQFLKSVAKIPKNQQEKLAKLFEILETNPFDSRFHTKQLSGNLKGLFSFRISREYRVLFRFLDENTLFLTQVKHRKDIYK